MLIINSVISISPPFNYRRLLDSWARLGWWMAQCRKRLKAQSDANRTYEAIKDTGKVHRLVRGLREG